MDYSVMFAEFSSLHRERRWPRQRMLHECLRAAIRSGRLAGGSRLVATRVLAAQLGLARNTVLYAYEQLASEGLVDSDRRGTLVSAVAGAEASAAGCHPGTGQDRPQHPAPAMGALSRRATALRWSDTPAVDPAAAFLPGVPALDHFPLPVWRRMLERAWRNPDRARLNYGAAAGEAALREAIADHLRASRGVLCDASQVSITDGTQDSLAFCLQALTDPGQRIWLENPGYGGVLAASRAAGLELAGIDLDADGMAPQAADWAERGPRLMYVTPSHQYPTGCVMGLSRRLALLDGARRCGALVIEDDYDSEFRHDGPPLPALQGLAPDAPVLYLGTFSKTMFPALRIGFVVAPTALAPMLLQLAAQIAPRGRSAEQLALAEFLRSGQFALHVRRMRRLYRQRRDALVTALARHVGNMASVHGASAGMHLALRLTDPAIDDQALAALAPQHGLALHALGPHTVQGVPPWRGFLLGYAQVPAERMDGLAQRLAGLLRAAPAPAIAAG